MAARSNLDRARLAQAAAVAEERLIREVSKAPKQLCLTLEAVCSQLLNQRASHKRLRLRERSAPPPQPPHAAAGSADTVAGAAGRSQPASPRRGEALAALLAALQVSPGSTPTKGVHKANQLRCEVRARGRPRARRRAHGNGRLYTDRSV